jgi:hypothetical protein
MAQGKCATGCLAVAVACVAFALAGTSRAAPAVASPFSDDVCLSPSDVTDSLVDPNGVYAASPKCKSLCKQARSDCAQYVKLAALCQKSEIGDDASYAKKECEVEHEDNGVLKNECKTEIEHSAGGDRSGLQVDRNDALDACDAWEHTCESSCP